MEILGDASFVVKKPIPIGVDGAISSGPLALRFPTCPRLAIEERYPARLALANTGCLQVEFSLSVGVLDDDVPVAVVRAMPLPGVRAFAAIFRGPAPPHLLGLLIPGAG